MDTIPILAWLLEEMKKDMPKGDCDRAMVIVKDTKHNLVVGTVAANEFRLISFNGKTVPEAYEEAVEMASDFIEACRPKRKKKSPNATDTSKNG